MNPSKLNCPLSCLSASYDIRVNFFQEQSDGLDMGHLRIYPYYDTSAVEKKTEILIYDVPKFLSAIGGTLGLYLGLSVLSVFFAAIKFCHKFKETRIEESENDYDNQSAKSYSKRAATTSDIYVLFKKSEDK